MVFKVRTFICFSALIVFSLIVTCTGQNFYKIHQHAEESPDERREKVVWCTVTPFEQRKCQNFAMAIERDKVKVYGSEYFRIECKQAFSKDECMTLLDEEKVTLTTLDSGQVFVGGRYHSLIPIAQEVLEGGFKYYYSVAVIKKNELSDVTSLRDLRHKRACFPGVGNMAGWVIPIYTLMREAGMKIMDCNNHVKSATEFFGPSCAVNCLTNTYNPIGDNSDKLCQLCIGKIPGGRCTDADPYAGYEGAFKCLLETGDVAFLKHTTVQELTTGFDYTSITKDRFELLCKDGSRRPVDEYRSCNWGLVPSDAVVTSSASSFEDRKKFQKFLERVVELYGPKEGVNLTTADDRNRNTFNNQYDQYDQFGNKINNRFKRQNFNQYGNRDQYPNNQDNYRDPNNQNDPNRYRDPQNQNDRDNYRDPNNQYDRDHYGDPNSQNNRDRDRYRDPNNQNDRDRYRDPNNQNDRDRYRDQDNMNRYNDPNNKDFYDPNRKSNKNPYANDPFSRDPYKLNKDQFGVNIDPYGKDPALNRDRDPFNGNRNSLDNNNQTNETYYEVFNLFESTPKYGIHGNLLFQDSTKRFAALPENQQTFSGYLGPAALDIIMGVRDCPVQKMTLCVTSDVEQEKCVKMRTALKAQLIKPEMNCYKGHSQIHCMQAIRGGQADVAVFDASDVYTAGLNFDLVPFISEVYNLGEPEYYVVAVAKESDPRTELTYLKNKYTCHGGINTAAGWVYPLAFLISNGWIRPYGCNSIRAAAEYFTKSCVPGALSTEYNTGVPYDNMCDLCHGASYRYCRRDASEDYYGHTGAFRCLVEGGGQVAFVKHTTVMENVGGKRKEWWARDNLAEDFELLCPDGTRAEVQDYKRCNLGKVRANAVVTRGGYGYNETQINAYINLLLYSQTFYGRKIPDEFSFSMFYSAPPYTDLIFQDATQQLKVIERSKRHYSDYVGDDFLRARRIVDCHAGSATSRASLLALTISSILALIVRN